MRRESAWQRARKFLFDSLQGRFVLAMLGGLALVQLTVNLVWYSQIEQRVRRQTELAAHHVTSGAMGAVRALRELPAAYRPLLIEQLRTMGGTRFQVFFNNAAVTVTPLPDQSMARMLEQRVTQELTTQLPRARRCASRWPRPSAWRCRPAARCSAICRRAGWNPR
ncbi:hypothetical protein [Roseateles chitinivorans]|uniref:hypothetical protein n=1 Tax=Roseateles chitinivorans TaxID=2917965 RepID=UPI003D66A098